MDDATKTDQVRRTERTDHLKVKDQKGFMTTAANDQVSVRTLMAEDWLHVVDIYAAGIATGHATFELEPPSWTEWDASRLADQRLVATINDTVVGWAALSPVSSRCVYRGVAENSVYVDPQCLRRGIGDQLLRALITQAEHAGIWMIQTGIFPENTASLALHANNGFRIVGYRERIGQHHGVWRDTVFLERRSATIGL
jgi:L-amino acid N-acyltransferase YncA